MEDDLIPLGARDVPVVDAKALLGRGGGNLGVAPWIHPLDPQRRRRHRCMQPGTKVRHTEQQLERKFRAQKDVNPNEITSDSLPLCHSAPTPGFTGQAVS